MWGQQIRTRLEGRGAGLTIGIIGCGLIGGSIGLAARRRWPRADVVGVDRPRVRDAAIRRKAIRRGCTRRQLWARMSRLDVLVLATGIDTIAADLQRLSNRGGPLTLDVGSVKGPIVQAAHALTHFVGGHPMAGNERGGIARASASMLRERPFVLTPAAATSRSALRLARRFVTELGARPVVLDADAHDRCVALVSHLPHLLSALLMRSGDALARELGSRRLPWSLAAGSWRDATRVAASDPAMWSSIFDANADALLEAVDGLLDELQAARAALADGTPAVPDLTTIARLRGRIERFLP